MGPQKRPLSATDFTGPDTGRRAKISESNGPRGLSFHSQTSRANPITPHAPHSPIQDSVARGSITGSPARAAVPSPASARLRDERAPGLQGSPRPPLSSAASAVFTAPTAPINGAAAAGAEPPSGSRSVLAAVASSEMRDWTEALAKTVEARIDRSNARKRLLQEESNYERMKPNYAIFKTFEETNRNSLNFARDWVQRAETTLSDEEAPFHRLTTELLPSWMQHEALSRRSRLDEEALADKLNALQAQLTAKDTLIADLTARVVSLEKRPTPKETDPNLEAQLELASIAASKITDLEDGIQTYEVRLSRTIAAFDGTTSKLSNSLNDVNARLSSNIELCQGLEIEVSQHEPRIKQLESIVESTQTTVATLEHQTQQNDMNKAQISSELATALGDKVTAIENKLLSFNFALSHHDKTLEEITTSLNTQELQDVSARLGRLEKEIEQGKEACSNLRNQTAVLSAQVHNGSVEARVKSAETEIAKLRTASQNYMLYSQYTTLMKTIETAKGDIRRHSAAIEHETERRIEFFDRLQNYSKELQECKTDQQNLLQDFRNKVRDLELELKAEGEKRRGAEKRAIEHSQHLVAALETRLLDSFDSLLGTTEEMETSMTKHTEGNQHNRDLSTSKGQVEKVSPTSPKMQNIRAAQMPAKALTGEMWSKLPSKQSQIQTQESSLSSAVTAQLLCLQQRSSEFDIKLQQLHSEITREHDENEAHYTEMASKIDADTQLLSEELRATVTKGIHDARQHAADLFNKIATRVGALESRQLVTSLTDDQVRDVREAITRCDGLTRVVQVLQQQYNNINTDHMAQQILNQLSVIYPAPHALQFEANRFEESRRQVHKKLQEMDKLSAQYADSANAALNSANTALRLEGKVTKWGATLETMTSHYEQLQDKVAKTEKSIRHLEIDMKCNNFEQGKLRGATEYLAEQHGHGTIIKALLADDMPDGFLDS